ncbi:MAG: hypothetical protein ONA90_09305 [candidate division KSB1 bacterium]|nr:hypothetical protein [candidate division KSB1 bacterium]
MEEKCYRDLQHRGEIAGVGLFELMALLAVTLLLMMLFNLLDLSFLYILVIDVIALAILRQANRISPFAHDLLSYVCFHFIWPKKLSAYQLEEHDYLVKKK